MQHLTWITCIEIIFKFLKESISEDHPFRFIDIFVEISIGVFGEMCNETTKMQEMQPNSTKKAVLLKNCFCVSAF